MKSKIGGFVGGGNWKTAHGTAHYGRNFSVKWLKLCELSFNKTHHLRNPYNDNLPVKISRDCQELEPFIGEQLASLLYLEPDSKLMAMLVAAELKREEEKAKGLDSEAANENPDIVLFEDNEDEEEDESEDEEDNGSGHAPFFGGRGRGRGMMWQPHMQMLPGGRPTFGVRGGFPPHIMGPDNFTAPDVFGVPHPRVFAPYGHPRFPVDFFPSMGAPPGGVFSIGPGRPPFMNGTGVPHSNRPMGMPPYRQFLPPPAKRRQMSDRMSDRNEKYELGSSEQGKGQDVVEPKSQTEDKYSSRNSFQNAESESEDEAAPRRSRCGNRRRSQEDSAPE